MRSYVLYKPTHICIQYTYVCKSTYKFSRHRTHSILITQQAEKFYMTKLGTIVNWLHLGLYNISAYLCTYIFI